MGRGLCHFSPIYKHDGVGGIAPYPFLLLDRGEVRGHPTEDGSEHERPARPPRAEVHLTHKEVFFVGRLTYVICVFNRVLFAIIIKCLYLAGGNKIYGEILYMFIFI